MIVNADPLTTSVLPAESAQFPPILTPLTGAIVTCVDVPFVNVSVTVVVPPFTVGPPPPQFSLIAFVSVVTPTLFPPRVGEAPVPGLL